MKYNNNIEFGKAKFQAYDDVRGMPKDVCASNMVANLVRIAKKRRQREEFPSYNDDDFKFEQGSGCFLHSDVIRSIYDHLVATSLIVVTNLMIMACHCMLWDTKKSKHQMFNQ